MDKISPLSRDLYALGVVIYLLLAGEPPERPYSTSLKKLGRGIPQKVSDLVAELLGATRLRPRAEDVFQRLRAAAT